MRSTRQALRHAQHNYSLPGAYFLTVCTFDRLPIFGRVRQGQMELSPLGWLAAETLQEMQQQYVNILPDASVIMPNHLHLILVLIEPRHDEGRRVASVGSLVGTLKSAVTRRARELWLPADYVIRHEGALARVREYIAHNPLQWSFDRENPQKEGDNPFYAWMEDYTQHLRKGVDTQR